MSESAGSRISSSSELGGYCAIAAMAKAPRAGEAKTRLVPPLSATEAATLSGCFIQDIAGNILAASRAAAIHGFVAYSPPGSEAAFRGLLPAEIRLLPSRRLGLKESLLDAAEELLAAGYGAVCLVNADSPTLPTAALVDAAKSLRVPGDRVVLGPASDGGYYLIGLKALHVAVFEHIDWSTDRVLRQTRARVASIGLPIVDLPSWYDIDDVAALGWLTAELFSGYSPGPGAAVPYSAPATKDYLRKLLGSDVDGRIGLDRGLTGSRRG